MKWRTSCRQRQADRRVILAAQPRAGKQPFATLARCCPICRPQPGRPSRRPPMPGHRRAPAHSTTRTTRQPLSCFLARRPRHALLPYKTNLDPKSFVLFSQFCIFPARQAISLAAPQSPNMPRSTWPSDERPWLLPTVLLPSLSVYSAYYGGFHSLCPLRSLRLISQFLLSPQPRSRLSSICHARFTTSPAPSERHLCRTRGPQTHPPSPSGAASMHCQVPTTPPKPHRGGLFIATRPPCAHPNPSGVTCGYCSMAGTSIVQPAPDNRRLSERGVPSPPSPPSRFSVCLRSCVHAEIIVMSHIREPISRFGKNIRIVVNAPPRTHQRFQNPSQLRP